MSTNKFDVFGWILYYLEQKLGEEWIKESRGLNLMYLHFFITTMGSAKFQLSSVDLLEDSGEDIDLLNIFQFKCDSTLGFMEVDISNKENYTYIPGYNLGVSRTRIKRTPFNLPEIPYRLRNRVIESIDRLFTVNENIFHLSTKELIDIQYKWSCFRGIPFYQPYKLGSIIENKNIINSSKYYK